MKAPNGQHIVGIYSALSPCLNAKHHCKFNQQKSTRPIYPTHLFWLSSKQKCNHDDFIAICPFV